MSVFSFVRLHAQPSSQEEFARAADAVLEPTRAEPGCQSIKLFRSTADHSIFFFHAQWKSAEDFQYHLESPHLKALLARVSDLLLAPPEMTLTERLG